MVEITAGAMQSRLICTPLWINTVFVLINIIKPLTAKICMNTQNPC